MSSCHPPSHSRLNGSDSDDERGSVHDFLLADHRESYAMSNMQSATTGHRPTASDQESIHKNPHTISPIDGATDGISPKKDSLAATAIRPVSRPSLDDAELDVTLDDLFDESKTAAENKSLMISAALDKMGMGRYQWCIFFLCGLGYLLDLLWAQALGLIATPIRSEFLDSRDQIGLLSTSFAVGLTVGAFTWGFLVDVLGRRWSFYLTCLISSIFGLAAGGPNTYAGLCTLTAFVGFGVGGNIPIDATITLEFLPTDRRFLLAMLSVFQPIGVLLCSGIAYGLIPRYSCELDPSNPNATCARSENMGWRYLLFTLGAITLFVFALRFAVFTFHESPQYLLARGRDDQALEVLGKIAKFNRVPVPHVSLDDFDEIERRLGIPRVGAARQVAAKETARESLRAMLANFANARILFRDRTMARITILLWLVFICDFAGFSLAGYFLPILLADKGAAMGGSLADTYKSYVAIYAPGIAACVLASFMVEIPRVGRQWAMVFSSALMAISFFLYAKVNSQAGSIGLNAMEYFFQSMFNAILYAFVPEAYPSAVRGTACGLASTWGRLASIVAPIVGQALYHTGGDNTGILYLAGGLTLLCPVALALLPFDTRGRRTY